MSVFGATFEMFHFTDRKFNSYSANHNDFSIYSDPGTEEAILDIIRVLSRWNHAADDLRKELLSVMQCQENGLG